MKAALIILASMVSAALAWSMYMWIDLETGDEELDKWRLVVLAGLAKRLLVGPTYARDMMAILHQEDAYQRPKLGDQRIARGPAAGPGQLLRLTAASLGYWHPEKWGQLHGAELRAALEADSEDRAEWEALGLDPNAQGMLLDWAIEVYARAVKRHGPGHFAFVEYNGSEAYAVAVDEFIASTWAHDKESDA